MIIGVLKGMNCTLAYVILNWTYLFFVNLLLCMLCKAHKSFLDVM